MKLNKVFFSSILFFSLLIAQAKDECDDCWIDCNVQITLDSVIVMDGYYYAFFQVNNITDDTLLISDKVERGYSYIEKMSNLATDKKGSYGKACGGGGSYSILRKDKCGHCSGKLKDDFRAKIEECNLQPLIPSDSFQIKVKLCESDSTKQLTEVSITKSFIYKHNKDSDNYNVCKRDEIKIKIHQ